MDMSFQTQQKIKMFKKMEDGAMVIPIGIALITIIILTWGWRVFNWTWLKPKKLERHLRQQGLAGNSYRFLVGDLKDHSRLNKAAKSRSMDLSDDIFPRIHPFYHHVLSTYGKNSFIWNGAAPVVMITDPELIKEVLSRMYEFPKTPKAPLAKLLAPGLAKYEGEKWAKHRRIMTPAFSTLKLKLMFPAAYESCKEMITKWEKMVSGNNETELDVQPDLDNLTADILSRTAFGSNYEEGRKIFHLQKELAILTMEVLRSVDIPGRRFVPTRRNVRMKEINKEMRDSLGEIIGKRKKEMEAGEAANDDLLGMLLESNLNEIQSHGNNKKFGMTIQEVMDECKMIYFVGQESVQSLLVWTMILLGKHQDWQARAREEVLRVFGKSKPHFEGLNHLKTVTMILNEVLRLYPSVTAVSRAVRNDETKLGRLSLPQGAQVLLLMILAQRDPTVWGDDAGEFKPERFSEGNSKEKRGTNSLLSFGWGPRICIGLNFGMMEAKLAVAMILKHFLVKPSPSYTHAPYTVKTLKAQHGAPVILSQLTR